MCDIIDSNSKLTFEDFKNENGIVYWWATDLMNMLGYPNMQSFSKVIDRATKAFVSLGIPHYENIVYVERDIDGCSVKDFKLTRFACYLSVMNGDPKKLEVAKAQAYFAQQTRMFEVMIESSHEIDRIIYRDELVEGNKSLSSVAKKAGVQNYAYFTNAGYLGMYNMKSWELEKKRGIAKGKLLDHMGRTELAANLFRVTQTEERIKSQNIQGQRSLEETHRKVGAEVRNIVIKNTGKSPENLKQEMLLPEVKKNLKEGYKKMKKEDDKKQD